MKYAPLLKHKVLWVTLLILATFSRVQAADYNLADIIIYDSDKSRTALAAVEAAAYAGDIAKRAAIEKDMIAVLADGKATHAAKQFACRILQLIGTEACVAPVATALTDAKLSDMVRFALQNNPCPQVDEAFRAALTKTSGDVQIGIINSISMRAAAKAVPPLSSLIHSPQENVAAAAILALGRIGTVEAADTLLTVKPQDTLTDVWGLAAINAGEHLAALKETKLAQKILRAAYVGQQKPIMKMAALRALIAVDAGAAAELPALLRANDPVIAVAAAQLLAEQSGRKNSQVIAAQLTAVSPMVQVVLLRNLAGRGDTEALSEVVQLATATNVEVAVAAIKTLGEIGGADQVAPLLKQAINGGVIGATAANSLALLRGQEVNVTLLKALTDTAAPIRIAALNALAARNAQETAAALLPAGQDPDPKVKSAAFKALRILAGPAEIQPLLTLLMGSTNVTERQCIQPALAAAVERSTDQVGTATLLTRVLTTANGELKSDLLEVLGRLGGAQARAVVRDQLQNPDIETRKAAVHALTEWRDATPLPDLLVVARGDTDSDVRILALRGYIELSDLPAQRSAAETLALYRQALELATRPEEKMLVLAGLARIKNAAAFKLAATCLGTDRRLNDATAIALAQLVSTLPGKPDAAAVAALKQILPLLKNKKLKQAVEQALPRLAPATATK